MKYSLDLDAPLQDEVRRVAAGRLTAAAGLLRERPEGVDNAIHDARRHIKQCRALYRLIASEAGDFQKAENGRLGDIGRRLSAMRDATALIEATDYLRHEIPTRSNGMLMDRLVKRLEQRREILTSDSEEAAGALATAERALAEAAEAVADLALPYSERKAAACLARGWEKIAGKARTTIAAARDGHDEAFHDLRKRTQDRWMHAALLRDLWPSAMTAMHRQGKTLSDMLGHVQDLAILFAAVSDSHELVSDGVEREAVRDVIVSRQTTLQAECVELANLLFGKSRPRDGKMIRRLLRGR
jgi:CHAD domain-containing protein